MTNISLVGKNINKIELAHVAMSVIPWPWKVDGNTNSWRDNDSKYLVNIKQVDDFGTLLNGIIYIHLYYNFYIMH
jgi:hypothetical protein